MGMKLVDKVSVIVPVYNLSSCLCRCVESLLRQTYSNLQIIFIDDGSSDNSVEILKTYAQKDDRILLLYQENAGVSVARNKALKQAVGEFVMFVDGDDWIEEETICFMLNILQQNQLDVVCSGIVFEDPKNKRRREETIKQELLILKGATVLNYFLQGKGLWSSVWARLYRKSFLDAFNFTFDSSLRIGEDGYFSLQVMSKAKSVAIVKPAFYHVLVRSDSATRMRTADGCKVSSILPSLYESYLRNNFHWENLELSYKVWYVRAITSELLRFALKNSYLEYKYRYNKYIEVNSRFLEYNVIKVRLMMTMQRHIAALVCKNCFVSYFMMRLVNLYHRGNFLF